MDFQKPNSKSNEPSDMGAIDFIQGITAAGFSVDYLNLVTEKIGFKIEYINGYQWADLLKLLQNRENVLALLVFGRSQKTLENDIHH